MWIGDGAVQDLIMTYVYICVDMQWMGEGARPRSNIYIYTCIYMDIHIRIYVYIYAVDERLGCPLSHIYM